MLIEQQCACIMELVAGGRDMLRGMCAGSVQCGLVQHMCDVGGRYGDMDEDEVGYERGLEAGLIRIENGCLIDATGCRCDATQLSRPMHVQAG